MQPNFILGGIMKSGTTFLHNLLNNHPQIAMLDRDMSYSYFDNDRIFAKGFEWYQQLFVPLKENLSPDSIIGQTSADCAFIPQAVARIMQVLPNTKLIFVLRHPIDRAYSLYWHQYSMAREHYSFEKAIEHEPKRIVKNSYSHRHYSYMARSQYKQQFDRILSIVPPENIILLPFNALTKSTLPTVNRVLEFLEVSLISDLEDLNYSKLPKNRARTPSNHGVVIIAAYLKMLGLKSPARRLLNMFRTDQRPPEMAESTKAKLTEILSEDISFYEKVNQDFSERLL